MTTTQTVLIVDDSPEDRYAIKNALLKKSTTRYVTLEAAMGAEALALCRQQRVDGILLDFLLPDIDGIAFLAALNREEATRTIPVAMLTGMGNELVAVQALKSGAQEYLIKGRTSPEELCRTVGAMIERSALLRQLAEQQRALEQREAMFRTSVETMLDSFGIYSALRNEAGEIIDFRIEYVNNAACVNNWLSREQQVGQRLCAILPAHKESGLFAEYCRVVETGEPLVKESLLYADVYEGQYLARAFDIRANKWGDGLVAAWRDISERKRAELERVQLLDRERAARQAAERAAGQLTRLHTLAAALSSATSVAELLDAIVRHTTRALDALSIGIGLLSSDGLTIELAPNTSPPSPDDVRQVSVMAPLPFADAVRRNQLIFFESGDDLRARYPLVAARVPAKLGSAGAVIPLAVNQQMLGALAVSWEHARSLDVEERALLSTIGQLCAQALDRARRYEAEHEAHLQLLAETGERERAVDAVRASEARYRALTEACAEMTWRTSPNGSAIFFTSAWQELTGQGDEAMQGWGWADAILAEDREQAIKVWLRALGEGEPYQNEFRVRGRDGVVHTLQSRAVPVRNDNGAIREWVGLNIDVTQQRQVEAQGKLLADLMQRLPLIITTLEHVQHPDEAIGLLEQQVCAASGAHGAAFRTSVSAETTDGAAQPHGSWLVFPLRRDGQTLGVLELSFPAPPALSEAQLSSLAVLTQLAVQTLTRLGWLQRGPAAPADSARHAIA